MIVYDFFVYQNVYIDKLLSPVPENIRMNYAIRVTIDLDSKTITNRSLVPDNILSIEFPQFNHRFEGKRYKYGYALTYPFVTGSTIIKIDVDSPGGRNNKVFKPNGEISLSEPIFVERPGAKLEDDGVIVARGLDPSINKTRVYILDAKTLKKVGEVVGPTVVPFGFHNKFYTKMELGMKPGKVERKSRKRS